MLPALSKASASDYRRDQRFDVSMPCTVERWGRRFPAITRNISMGGLCVDIQGMGSNTFGAELTITLPDCKPVSVVPRWSHRRSFGLQFKDLTSENPELLALIVKLQATS